MDSDSDYLTSEEAPKNEYEDLSDVSNSPVDIKGEKKTRKKNKNSNENIKEVIVDNELLSKIKISQNQLKKLKPKTPRSEKQIQSAQRLVDLRKERAQKEREEKQRQEEIRLQVMAKRAYKKKQKEEIVVDSDSEDEKPKKGFQARKPKLYEPDDELDEKVEKLNKLNNVLNNNPYYVSIMRHRGFKI